MLGRLGCLRHLAVEKTREHVVFVRHAKVVVDIVLVLVEHTGMEVHGLHVVETLSLSREVEAADSPEE